MNKDKEIKQIESFIKEIQKTKYMERFFNESILQDLEIIKFLEDKIVNNNYLKISHFFTNYKIQIGLELQKISLSKIKKLNINWEKINEIINEVFTINNFNFTIANQKFNNNVNLIMVSILIWDYVFQLKPSLFECWEKLLPNITSDKLPKGDIKYWPNNKSFFINLKTNLDNLYKE